MARFLLVGGAGFIGSHLARRLVDSGEQVTVLDAGDDYGRTEPARQREILDWRHRELLRDVAILRGDTRDPHRLREVTGDAEPTHIVHLANLPLSELAAINPAVAHENIVEGTLNVLYAAAGLPHPPALTYVSSSMVYGNFNREPMPENVPGRPHCVYGRLKLAAERALTTRARAASVPMTIVRPSAVYGPGDVNGRVLQRLVDAAAQDSPFVLHTTPEARLDFTWVDDVAAGLHAAALAGSACGSIYNITAGEAHTLRAAIAAVRRHAPRLEVVGGPRPAVRRPRRGTLDIGRAQRELGWSPRWPLQAGLQAYLAFANTLATSAPIPDASG